MFLNLLDEWKTKVTIRCFKISGVYTKNIRNKTTCVCGLPRVKVMQKHKVKSTKNNIFIFTWSCCCRRLTWINKKNILDDVFNIRNAHSKIINWKSCVNKTFSLPMFHLSDYFRTVSVHREITERNKSINFFNQNMFRWSNLKTDLKFETE